MRQRGASAPLFNKAKFSNLENPLNRFFDITFFLLNKNPTIIHDESFFHSIMIAGNNQDGKSDFVKAEITKWRGAQREAISRLRFAEIHSATEKQPLNTNGSGTA